MIRETFDVSGFGGGYEDMCQTMLWRGVKHLEEVKPPVEMWKKASQNPQIYGVLLTEGAELKQLESVILKPGDDATGAMHHCVMNHLAFIHQNGLDKWREELRAVREGSFFWDDEEMKRTELQPGLIQ